MNPGSFYLGTSHQNSGGLVGGSGVIYSRTCPNDRFYIFNAWLFVDFFEDPLPTAWITVNGVTTSIFGGGVVTVVVGPGETVQIGCTKPNSQYSIGIYQFQNVAGLV